MRLLTGPAGSGKTFRVLTEFRASLANGGGRLLVPTATLQQHLQNELAREGLVFRSGAVSTLARFAAELAPQLRPVQPEFLQLMVAGAVQAAGRQEFAKVAEMAGFHARLATTITDLDSAGCTPDLLAKVRGELAPFRDALVAVWRQVQAQMSVRGLLTRGEMLRAITKSMGTRKLPERIWLDGFAHLSGPEIELIRALGERVDLTLTLPDEGVPPAMKQALRDVGFREERLTGKHEPDVQLEVRETIEREVEEIARIVLMRERSGIPFREMGVVLRQPARYEARLRSTFARFGIPAHFYFGTPLASHSSGRLMLAVVKSLRSGWEHESVLDLLRLTPVTGWSRALDELELRVRENLPGSGLEPLFGMAAQNRALLRLLRSLEPMGAWLNARFTGAQWAERLASLPALFWPGAIPDGLAREEAERYRLQAAGLRGFLEALDAAAEWFGENSAPLSLDEFWAAAKSVIALSSVKAENRSRNVVHVVSAYEARQWDFSVAFVCGLVEKQFPAQGARDPFLSDAALRDLVRFGVRARTSLDKDEEERGLFDAIRVRARDVLVLSYPRVDARGQRTLPSIFLKDYAEHKVDVAVGPALPPPVAGRRTPSWVKSADLLAAMADLQTVFSVTSLESLLQCPFQFFANRTLRVFEMPDRPEDRLNALLQGSIVHETLREWWGQDKPAIQNVFARQFGTLCAEKRVPPGFRRERARRAMLLALERFVEYQKYQHAGDAWVEKSFEFAIDPTVSVRGKLDRIDLQADGRAIVVDYKYSNAANTKNRVDDETKLQGPLYALALRRAFGVEPAAMIYMSLKDEKVMHDGWGDAPLVSRALTEEWMESAVTRVREAVAEFRSGTIHPRPAKTDPCRYCAYRDACRVEQPVALPAAGA